jgi:ArsR family transcriptional regulator
MGISTILKILSDENRLRIMNILKEYSLCAGEIQTILNIKQSNASRHLEKLKSNRLITNQKKAQWIYYQLCNEQLEEYSFIKHLLFEDIKNYSIYQEDLYKLNKYKSSGLCCQDLRNIGFDFNKIKF